MQACEKCNGPGPVQWSGEQYLCSKCRPSTALVKRDHADLVARARSLVDHALARPRLAAGDGDLDKAARAILRAAREAEERHGIEAAGGEFRDAVIVQLESETELHAAETLEDRGFGHVVKMAGTWVFLAGEKR